MRAQRDNAKVLVRDVVRDVGFRRELKEQLTQEVRREHGFEIDRGWGRGMGRRLIQGLLLRRHGWERDLTRCESYLRVGKTTQTGCDEHLRFTHPL